MGTPMLDDLKATIQIFLVKNNEVSSDYVNFSSKDYGTDVKEIKGKTTRIRKPVPVISNIVKLPKEFMEVQQDLTFLMDGLAVNSVKLPFTISHELYYRTYQYVTKPVASIYKGCMA